MFPDAGRWGQSPKEWAATGAVLILIFNFIGVVLWIMFYLDARKRGPKMRSYKYRSTAVDNRMRL